MAKIIWILVGLFVIGDALFVLPLHLSNDKITSSYFINYKKDSDLLRNVFPDTAIFHLQLNMPERLKAVYVHTDSTGKRTPLLVNVSMVNDLDFTAVSFPFYKTTNFNAIISFANIIKLSNMVERDSTALIGNIEIRGRLTITGICSPLYVRTLVEKELAKILNSEMDKIERDINWRPPLVPDTLTQIAPAVKKISVKHAIKKSKK